MERFQVSYIPTEYGYVLHPVDKPDDVVVPEFGQAAAREEFDKFFAPENLKNHIGKVIYCDCQGQMHSRDGIVVFTISTAEIYSKAAPPTR